MVSFDPPYGFAIRRNGSCLSEESSCGGTWGTWSACCPHDTVCPGKFATIQNNVCCPSKADCTNAFQSDPHCADDKWVLFNSDGNFCCEKGQEGFVTDKGVGCSDGPPPERSETILLPVSTSSSTSSTTHASRTTSASASATTSVSTSSSSSPQKQNTGAIAGGTVGGVAGLALIAVLGWFLLRRRKRDTPPEKMAFFGSELEQKDAPVWGGSYPPGEVSEQNYPREPQELPSH